MSKKFIMGISMLVLVVSIFSIAVSAAPQLKDMLFYADFEDGKLDGWEVEASVKIVDVPGGKGKCALLERSEAEAATHTTETPTSTTLTKVLDKPLEGIVTIEYKMMTDTLKQNKAFVVQTVNEEVEGGPALGVLRVQFAGKRLRILQPAGAEAIDIINPFEENKWYSLKLVINTSTAKVDVYLDGKKELEQISTEIVPKNIIGVRANIYGSAVGKLFIDDIMVYQESSTIEAPKTEAPKVEVPKVEAPKAAATKNPNTGDSGMMIYGLFLVSAIGTSVAIKKR